MKDMIFLINDKAYRAVPEEDPHGNSCSGCAFSNSNGCNAALDILIENYYQPRGCDDLIYKEVVETIKGKKKLLIL